MVIHINKLSVSPAMVVNTYIVAAAEIINFAVDKYITAIIHFLH